MQYGRTQRGFHMDSEKNVKLVFLPAPSINVRQFCADAGYHLVDLMSNGR